MTLQECYAALGGDLEATLGRLRSERLVQKFVLKFLDDSSYRLLHESLAAGNGEEAFRAAHTMKGTCQNLGFDRLAGSSSTLCEALRGGVLPADPALVARVDEDYRRTAEAIEAYRAGLA